MSDVDTNDIRLTIKQRTWIMSYLVMDTPHDPNDLFCLLLMELMGQPLAAGEDLGQWAHLEG